MASYCMDDTLIEEEIKPYQAAIEKAKLHKAKNDKKIERLRVMNDSLLKDLASFTYEPYSLSADGLESFFCAMESAQARQRLTQDEICELHEDSLKRLEIATQALRQKVDELKIARLADLDSANLDIAD